tara:strand:+ start:41934 stop:42245 length:312 start_codon:yes stop_codon:yes gene_type:complete
VGISLEIRSYTAPRIGNYYERKVIQVMTYLKTINLWDKEMARAVEKGQLKLQVGQWVQCGGGRKSRFVGVTPTGSVWVAHWQGSFQATQHRFRTLAKSFRGEI